MTKKLEETFNLPQTKKQMNEIKKDVAQEKATAIIDNESVVDHDKKMDKYADDAYGWAAEVMELGMGSEPRHSADMFNAASNMMKVALEAKNSKIDKRLRLYDLELKRKKLEMEEAKLRGEELGSSDGVFNREDLLKDDDDE